MAKKENKEVLNDVNAEEKVVEVKEVKEVKKAEKSKKEKAKKVKTSKNSDGKRSRVKETFSELKKVTWPSFGKAMKQTGMVLSLVLVFGVLVLGIDLLISFIINTLSSF